MGARPLLALALIVLAVSLPYQWLFRHRTDLTAPQKLVVSQYCAAGTLYGAVFFACLARHLFVGYTDPSPLLGLGGLIALPGPFLAVWCGKL